MHSSYIGPQYITINLMSEENAHIQKERLEEFKTNQKTSYLAQAWERLDMEEKEVRDMSEDGMEELAHEELESIKEQKEGLWKQMEEIAKTEEKEEEFPNQIILEIRAGAGGDEASMFAGDLKEMYEKYAEIMGYTMKVISSSPGGAGGYKEVVMEVNGLDVYRNLRFEMGVHRVQRIPETEKAGRTHTSTASVAVLPIRKKSTFHIDPSEVEMSFSRSGGKGGQNVNKVETAVRVVHIPTGLEVRSTAERSQLKNREIAMNILTARLEEMKREEEEAKYAAERKEQIGTADRSEKIRTYNVLQDRVTDHRIKQNWHNIEAIFNGYIEPMLADIREVLEADRG